MRSYRGPNSHNRQPSAGAETAFLGARAARAGCKQALRARKATWKVIAADMPIGLLVGDGKDAEGRDAFEAVANGDGPALGRELEIADLLRFIKRSGIRNVVWLTADVHYTAAHYYDPAKAQFTDFEPFWEFVSGPLNAGSFGPGKTRRHLRARGRLPEGARAGQGQPAAHRRPAVLRRRSRSTAKTRRDDGVAQGPDRRHAVAEDARARTRLADRRRPKAPGRR